MEEKNIVPGLITLVVKENARDDLVTKFKQEYQPVDLEELASQLTIQGWRRVEANEDEEPYAEGRQYVVVVAHGLERKTVTDITQMYGEIIESANTVQIHTPYH